MAQEDFMEAAEHSFSKQDAAVFKKGVTLFKNGILLAVLTAILQAVITTYATMQLKGGDLGAVSVLQGGLWLGHVGGIISAIMMLMGINTMRKIPEQSGARGPLTIALAGYGINALISLGTIIMLAGAGGLMELAEFYENTQALGGISLVISLVALWLLLSGFNRSASFFEFDEIANKATALQKLILWIIVVGVGMFANAFIKNAGVTLFLGLAFLIMIIIFLLRFVKMVSGLADSMNAWS